ncbi:hypothetical protein CYMTET_33159 [Cymbomonas tetramitiformis]|uniref:Uncharacterized protein n=1 Tax=Cymbomonas tetramitiformis TaxID=36881 RepID=A0AAE0FEB0_9CHLO|nr:hypothetical protein CYMTET_33159 [Cymbomonas tetramitiformis]
MEASSPGVLGVGVAWRPLLSPDFPVPCAELSDLRSPMRRPIHHPPHPSSEFNLIASPSSESSPNARRKPIPATSPGLLPATAGLEPPCAARPPQRAHMLEETQEETKQPAEGDFAHALPQKLEGRFEAEESCEEHLEAAPLLQLQIPARSIITGSDASDTSDTYVIVCSGGGTKQLTDNLVAWRLRLDEEAGPRVTPEVACLGSAALSGRPGVSEGGMQMLECGAGCAVVAVIGQLQHDAFPNHAKRQPQIQVLAFTQGKVASRRLLKGLQCSASGARVLLAAGHESVLLAGGEKGSVRCWQLTGGWDDCVSTWDLPCAVYGGVVFNAVTQLVRVKLQPGIIVGCSCDGDVAVWDYRAGGCLLYTAHLLDATIADIKVVDSPRQQPEARCNGGSREAVTQSAGWTQIVAGFQPITLLVHVTRRDENSIATQNDFDNGEGWEDRGSRLAMATLAPENLGGLRLQAPAALRTAERPVLSSAGGIGAVVGETGDVYIWDHHHARWHAHLSMPCTPGTPPMEIGPWVVSLRSPYAYGTKYRNKSGML